MKIRLSSKHYCLRIFIKIKSIEQQYERFQLDIRKKILILRVVEKWNKLLRKVVDSPLMKFFKHRLYRNLLEML